MRNCGVSHSIEDVENNSTNTGIYLKALVSYRDGKDNLIPPAEKLKELGIKSGKKIPKLYCLQTLTMKSGFVAGWQ